MNMMKDALHQELVRAAHQALAGEQAAWEHLSDVDRIDYSLLVDAFWEQLLTDNTLIFAAEQVYKRIDDKDYDLNMEAWGKLAKYHGVNWIKMANAVLERLVSLAEQTVEQSPKEDH
jgi:hypothetical protein